MFQLTNDPSPAVATLAAPQRVLNARTLRRDRLRLLVRNATIALLIVLALALAYLILCIGADIVRAQTAATLQQALSARGM